MIWERLQEFLTVAQSRPRLGLWRILHPSPYDHPSLPCNPTIPSFPCILPSVLPTVPYHAYDHPYHALPEVEASKGFSTIASDAIPGQCSGLRAILHRSRGRLYAYQPKAPRCAQPKAIPNRSSNVLAYQGVARS